MTPPRDSVFRCTCCRTVTQGRDSLWCPWCNSRGFWRGSDFVIVSGSWTAVKPYPSPA